MGKRLAVISLAILLASFIYIIAVPLSFGAAPTTVVYVDPPKVESETLTPGSTFNVTVKVANIPADPGLAGLQFKLSWNSSVLNGVSMQEVMFHNVTPEAELDNLWKLKHIVANDSVSYSYTYQDIDRARAGGYMPISGNYTIAEIKLKVNGLGKTTLHFESVILGTILGDGEASTLPCDLADGYFSNLPRALVSNFSYSPEKPRVNETVTFNASASYDSDGTIVSYSWNFGDNNITTAIIPYIAHTYNQPGNYSVTLNVTDSNGLWNTTTSLINARIAVHDIAITEIKPYRTTVPTNSNTNISVTVENQGDYTETFNVTLHVNNTSIETRTINNVPEKTPIVINFTWNTTGFLGSYSISATASNVTGETDGADSALVDGYIVVTAPLQGDMNSDGIVDIYDALILAGAYNSKPGDPNWNVAADINHDNVVDIYDAILLANNYGKTA